MFDAKPQAEIPLPTACPFCSSTKITTAGKFADQESYWRCEECGDVWNAARLQHGQPPTRRRPYDL